MTPSRTARTVVVEYQPWSNPDVLAVLRLRERTDVDEVVVFVLDDIDELWPMQQVLPDAPPVHQSPVVGEYRSGIWSAFAQGPSSVAALLGEGSAGGNQK